MAKRAHRFALVLLVIVAAACFGISGVAAQEGDSTKSTSGDFRPNAQATTDIIARTPAGEDVTVRPGETVALGHPKESPPRDQTWSYSWEVENGDTSELLLHTGSGESLGPAPPGHNGRVTSFRATEEGTYIVNLTVRSNTDPEEIVDTFKRRITVSESDRGVSYEKMKRYAPVLRFEEDELYKPTRIEAIFENAELRRGDEGSRTESTVLENANLYYNIR